MNQEWKAKWIAALRSGKYIQGKRTLHQVDKDGDRYCCLGVLCKLLYDEGYIERESNDHEGYSVVQMFIYDSNRVKLSDRIMNMICISEDDAEDLIDYNDNEKKDFEFISDYIEENL